MIDMITRSFNNRSWFSQHIPAIVTKIPAKVDTIPARDQKQEHDKVRAFNVASAEEKFFDSK
jgi:hypothetical protein